MGGCRNPSEHLVSLDQLAGLGWAGLTCRLVWPNQPLYTTALAWTPCPCAQRSSKRRLVSLAITGRATAAQWIMGRYRQSKLKTSSVWPQWLIYQDWDLNTGQTVRIYPTHGAQISSVALRPTGAGAAESAIKETNGIDVAVNVGPDYFAKDRAPSPKTNGDGPHPDSPPAADAKVEAPSTPTVTAAPSDPVEAKVEQTSTPAPAQAETNGDIDMGLDAPSPYDPLFDDADAEGESVLPSANGTALPTPQMSPPPPYTESGLALPGSNPHPPAASPTPKETPVSTPLFSQSNAQAGPSRTGVGAAGTIPLLTRTSFDTFSEDIMMTSSMDGQVTLIDRRVPTGPESANGGVGRLQAGEKAPPWCMSVSRPSPRLQRPCMW